MTKLLILSDSHNSASAVERILHAESDANAVVFLGDGLRDLEEALTLHPKMKVYAVAGNCDFGALEPLDGLAAFDQVVVFYTHGHMYGVKWTKEFCARECAESSSRSHVRCKIRSGHAGGCRRRPRR